MEKFSAYRDLGTGIQPFLPPVPPLGLATATLPLRYLLAIVRSLLVLLLLLAYIAIVPPLSILLSPIPPLRRVISHLFTAIFARAALLVLGFLWLPVEHVKRKRGRNQNKPESWKPRAGDLIVSNWASSIELLWLAFRFNPIFVLPITHSLPVPPSLARGPAPITHTPGRRTGTGSANIQSPLKAITSPSLPILGFRPVSLLSIIRSTGHIPPFGYSPSDSPITSLEDLRKTADRPIVVFPECTTSNGRALLRFAKVFRRNAPVKDYQVFVMCVRCDPPTILSPTSTWSIPSALFNPLPHLFTLASSITPPAVSFRLLAPSDSPSSPLFIVSEIITESNFTDDQLTEVCATLIAQVGKMKRTGLGWEDKAAFLNFYCEKRK